jgi:hypothetical protein
MNKICSSCNRSLPKNEFHKCSRSKSGVISKCKECRSIDDKNKFHGVGSKSYAYTQKYRSANKEKIAASNKKYKEANKDKILNEAKRWRENNVNKISSSRRKSNYKKRYSITMDDYDKMFNEQEGVCYICHEPSLNQRLSVDHDHKTNKVRKLLCTRCNLLLGVVEKNLELIEQFKIYLNERS